LFANNPAGAKRGGHKSYLGVVGWNERLWNIILHPLAPMKREKKKKKVKQSQWGKENVVLGSKSIANNAWKDHKGPESKSTVNARRIWLFLSHNSRIYYLRYGGKSNYSKGEGGNVGGATTYAHKSRGASH